MGWAYYRRPDGDTVVLMDNEGDRLVYEAKGFKYVGEAPAPGKEENVPDAVVHAAALKEVAAAGREAEKEYDALQARRATVERRNERAAEPAAGGEAVAVRAVERGEAPMQPAPPVPPKPAEPGKK